MRTVQLDAPGPGHAGTTLTDTETGEKLHGIRAIRAIIEVDAVNVIEAEFICALTTARGLLVAQVRDPHSGDLKEVNRIIFADGTEWAA